VSGPPRAVSENPAICELSKVSPDPFPALQSGFSGLILVGLASQKWAERSLRIK
jgi:hypothetical protein